MQRVVCGSWRSPITASSLASGQLRIETLKSVFGSKSGSVCWVESRPQEKGRCVVARFDQANHATVDIPSSLNTRTGAHEYGGGAYAPAQGFIVTANHQDQRLYKVTDDGEKVTALTPEAVDWRFADMCFDGRGGVLCVLEDHSKPNPAEVVNCLARVALDGSGVQRLTGEEFDFVQAPAVSEDGSLVAFVTWHHPNMPWDRTHLRIGRLTDSGLEDTRVVCGDVPQAIQQPRWGPDGKLYFVSDISGWWNLHRYDPVVDSVEPVLEMQAEFGRPTWSFGLQTYTFAQDALYCVFSGPQASGFGRIHLASQPNALEILTVDGLPNSIGAICTVSDTHLAVLAGSPTIPLGVYLIDTTTLQAACIKTSLTLDIPETYLARPVHIAYPTPVPDTSSYPVTSHSPALSATATSYGWLYHPQNPNFEPSNQSELPPLLVLIHGGPTSSATTTLRLDIQFWTTRGFAVIDVDHRGSTGYGRAFREQMNGLWGVVDVWDCCAAVQYCVQNRFADPNRVCIQGGSAGGFTVFACLTSRPDLFKSACALYGVSDLLALAQDTHKFEMRYLDRLIGELPKDEDVYHARSPIRNVEHLTCPLLLLQGDEDMVVPPNQSQAMYESVKKRGIPTCYVLFEGEQHGFRKSETKEFCFRAQLHFFAKTLGFELPNSEEAPPFGLAIDNLPKQI